MKNPCLTCYFDWKDYCSPEKRKACAEKEGEFMNSPTVAELKQALRRIKEELLLGARPADIVAIVDEVLGVDE